MYFQLFIRKSWGKRSAHNRRRLAQSFPRIGANRIFSRESENPYSYTAQSPILFEGGFLCTWLYGFMYLSASALVGMGQSTSLPVWDFSGVRSATIVTDFQLFP